MAEFDCILKLHPAKFKIFYGNPAFEIWLLKVIFKLLPFEEYFKLLSKVYAILF